MLIIFGKKLDENKKVRIGLTEIFGIGISNAKKLCYALNIPQALKISELTENQTVEISVFIKENFIVEAKLQQIIKENINTYIAMNSVRGFRHRMKLPVRGQRTHSNAKTCKKRI